MCDKLTNLTNKIEALEETLGTVTSEKETLKARVQIQAEEIAELRHGLNEREQYTRSWSMRILNVAVPSDRETDTRLVMQVVYDSLLQPILEGAMSKGEISSYPDCEALLETAHILPGKTKTKPIITRFYSRYWRNLVFRHRREFAPKEPAPAPAAGTRASTSRTSTRMKYPFFEDLTRATFAKLTATKQHEQVTSAWTVNGSIRFKVKDNETVFRISKLTDTVEFVVG